jgi:hypothetical protein
LVAADAGTIALKVIPAASKTSVLLNILYLPVVGYRQRRGQHLQSNCAFLDVPDFTVPSHTTALQFGSDLVNKVEITINHPLDLRVVRRLIVDNIVNVAQISLAIIQFSVAAALACAAAFSAWGAKH